MDTKRKIQETALDLFSKRGFSAVSIRDIGKIVGVKESTIYYHFKNKQDIFNTLINEFVEESQAKQNRFNSELAKVTNVYEHSFTEVGLAFLNGFLLEERTIKFIRMLMIEQQINSEAAELSQRLLFEMPLMQNATVFNKMIQMGCFNNGNENFMAEEYYAPIFLIFMRYFYSGEVTEDKRARANEKLKAHLICFYRKYSSV